MTYMFKRPLLRSIRSLPSIDGKVCFPVIHLGTVQILCPVGDGICGSMEEIFENCRLKLKQKQLPKSRLEIKDGAFELLPDNSEGKVYIFSRIIYCGVDSRRRKILVFNYHQGEGEGRDSYRTHAIMCESKTVAKKLALVVGEYFRSVKSIGEIEDEPNGTGKGQVKKKSKANNNKDRAKKDIDVTNTEIDIELGSV